MRVAEVTIAGTMAQQTFLVSRLRPRVLIGRVPPADVVVADRLVSRRHCLLVWDEAAGTVWLEDAGSMGGIFVNGERVAPRRPLAAGDVARIGASSLRVRYLDAVEEHVPAPPVAAVGFAVSAWRSPTFGDLRHALVVDGEVWIPSLEAVRWLEPASFGCETCETLECGDRHGVRIVRLGGAVIWLPDGPRPPRALERAGALVLLERHLAELEGAGVPRASAFPPCCRADFWRAWLALHDPTGRGAAGLCDVMLASAGADRASLARALGRLATWANEAPWAPIACELRSIEEAGARLELVYVDGDGASPIPAFACSEGALVPALAGGILVPDVTALSEPLGPG